MVRARACARTGYAAALGFVRNPFPQHLLPKTSLSVRLAQIKLAGFKSFADPTLIELKDAFTGVVGPNGCGKSNIIDAVRWVLGEGRASELRGSSTMTDLIFSGSATRAPIGRAMVELVLDNSDGTVKGPWAAFAELSVRRVVTRDGTSAYFINHQQVRRRDVQEIFMGTGLGPKSYAIISQGMVTDFIKAKPEELRGYIEEAAGVSLYKERRRETETLLRGTRENLDRAGDLQVVKQQEIDRLRAEAETAARWKALEAQKLRSESLWYFLQYEEARRAAEEARAAVAKNENEIAQKKAALEEADLEREQLEAAVLDATGRHESAAKALAEAEKALARLEGELKHLLEKRRLAERSLAEAEATLEEKRAALEKIDGELEAAAGAADELEETLAELEEASLREEAALEAAREDERKTAEAAAALSTRLERERRVAAERDAKYAAERARLEELERRAKGFDAEREALEKPDEALLEEAEETAEVAAALAEEAAEAREAADAAQSDAHDALEAANEAYFSTLSKLKAQSATLETLEAVQAQAAQSDRARDWLEETGLIGMPELARTIDVEPAWVTALEAVLEKHVRAMLLRDLRTVAGFAEARPPVRAVFVAPVDGIGVRLGGAGETQAADAERANASQESETHLVLQNGASVPKLLQFVRVTDAEGDAAAAGARAALAAWLAHTGAVESLAEAMRLRSALGDADRLVTPAGDVVTRASISFWADDDPSLSMLSREQDIRRAAEMLERLEIESGEKDDARKRAADALESAKERAQTTKRMAAIAQERLQAARAARGELLRAKAEYVRREADLKLSHEALLKEVDAKRTAVDEAMALAEEALDALDALEREAVRAQDAERRARERRAGFERDALRKSHALSLKRMALNERQAQRRSLTTRRTDIAADIEREEKRAAAARAELEENVDTRVEATIESRLLELDALEKAERAAAQALALAKEKAAANERIARTLREQILPLTESLGDLRAAAQQNETLRDQFSARMDELGADWTAMAVLAQTRGVKAVTVRNEVSRFMNEMAALGPVNHAALDHLKAAEDAYKATAAQMADLEQAIATLEAAIRKIDQETRARIRETFEAVRAHFAECFRVLFGGGRAELVMTGEEILSAGIEVIAQPPGKRNASVKSLSGGEQTLTATALVFAMFRLNPAPFCLLDEVDGPLDEANQARLASLCLKMAEATQFLIITHNRITMEFATSLIGVTMKEPGVSRVVSVDIDEAVSYAQNAKARRLPG